MTGFTTITVQFKKRTRIRSEGGTKEGGDLQKKARTQGESKGEEEDTGAKRQEGSRKGKN